ncbi:MAG: hypothetical protein QXY55_05965 [Candidatus Korarchaeota archaeon]
MVDLFVHPSFAWVMYLDCELLLEKVETIEVDLTDAEVREC